MKPTFKYGAAILGVSLVGAAFSTVHMGRRISGFNKELPEQFLFKPTYARAFTAFGHEVSLTDTTMPGDLTVSPPVETRDAVKLAYGASSVVVPVISPKVKDFKDLSVYEDSLRVLQFAPIKDGKAQIKDFSDENWRAVVIARETRPGFEQETWGEVRVKDWTWLIYELRPDGTIAQPRTVQFRDRRGRTPAEVYARAELTKAGKPTPELPEKGGPRLTGVEPIEERSWEWQAALFTIPKMQISRYRYRTDGVSSMGWTFAGAGLSVLGIVLGSGLMMAARTERTR